MPRRKTHVAVGGASGAIVAAYRSRALAPAEQILEAVGGILGGYWGGRAPDILEPSSLGGAHRSFCHSWVTMLAGVKAFEPSVSKWEQFCRLQASDAAALRQNLTGLTDLQKFSLILQEMAWRIAAGILSGLIAGYVSHLGLDALTPKSLPVIA